MSLAERAVRSALRRRAEFFASRHHRMRIGDHPVTLISNDCWAGEFYRLRRHQYTSPFVGLMVMAPCYMKLLRDLPRALLSQIDEVHTSRYSHLEARRLTMARPYPVGRLAAVDAEVHFLHYPSFAQAVSKWHRRAARVDMSRLAVVLTADKDYCTDVEVSAFAGLPFDRKLLVSARPYPQLAGWVVNPFSVDAVQLYHVAALRYDMSQWLRGAPAELHRRQRLQRHLQLSHWSAGEGAAPADLCGRIPCRQALVEARGPPGASGA